MNYRIGLDIGISSIGWSVIENDENEHPARIVDLGVRLFSPAEINNKGENKPLALDRRIARGTRRRIRRMKYRIQSVSNFLCKKFNFAKSYEELNKQIESKNFNVYELRHKALNEKLDNLELAKILLYFVKHRGYLCTSSSEDNADVENSKMKNYLSGNDEKYKNSGYETYGEYLYQSRIKREYEKAGKTEFEYIYQTRNHNGEYTKCIKRDLLVEEIKTILEKQQSFGNNLIDLDFISDVLEIFNKQRNFDEGPNSPSPYRGLYNVGNCTLIPTEKRAPKGAFSFEYYSALQKINQLTIIDENGKHIINDEQKKLLQEKLFLQKEIKYTSVRKFLKLPETTKFNGLTYSRKENSKKDPENTKFVSLTYTYKISEALSEENINKNNKELYNKLAEILSYYKSDEKRNEQYELYDITKKLSEEQKNKLNSLKISKFGNLSIVAIDKILPYLENGELYDKACSNAGLNFNVSNKQDFAKSKKIKIEGEVNEYLKDITNPVLRRAISQVIKVVNAIIDKYGSPQLLFIELARDIKKTIKERKEIQKKQNARMQNNENLANDLRKFNIEPTSKNMTIYKLYQEQGGKSVYSGKSILETCGVSNGDIKYLFDTNIVQVDHIIPYSKSFDDSWENKVLVLTKENQDKGNRTPIEWLSSNNELLEKYLDFVSTTYSANQKKTEHLLSNGSKNIEDWRSASLNDTRSITVYVKDLFERYLLFAESKYKRQVFCVNGRITNYLGKVWGITKDRNESDKHHARDACLIAVAESKMLQEITQYFKWRYYYEHNNVQKVDTQDDKYYIIKDTGEKLTKEEYEKYITKYVVEPYPNFRKELMARLCNDPQHPEKYYNFIIDDCYMQYSEEQIKSVKPIFVSQMANHKATGKLFDDTIYGQTDKLDKNGKCIYTKKVSLTKLSLTTDKKDIKDYYEKAKIDDPATYNAVLKRLQEFDGNAEKAFGDPNNPLYKPTKDGKKGNIIKKVKLQDVSDNYSILNDRGLTKVDNMLRIDIFSKGEGSKKKYYAVPVYLIDIYKGKLPTKICSSSKPSSEWDDISNAYSFEFSLYKGDLFRLKIADKSIVGILQGDGKTKVETTDEYFYYNGFDRSTNSISFKTHDDSVKFRGIGFQSATIFEKYNVDMLGNINKVTSKKREMINKK